MFFESDNSKPSRPGGMDRRVDRRVNRRQRRRGRR